MRYLSVCSGIEAATVAWHHMGWEAVGYSEIEKFPSQVLAHHYPNVTNYGDMTKFKEWDIGTIDLLVGGTPCQSFSVAGLRKGLDDPRGNLMLTYLAIARQYHPKWLVWENVPGVLSSNGGNDFASFLRGLAELGYGFAYRVLDAQYFGVAQRRRRVFVIGCLGNWQRAAAVLFERNSLFRDTKKSRKKKENITTFVESSFGAFREDTTNGTAKASGGVLGGGSETISVVYEMHPADSRVSEMGETCQTVTSRWGTGGGNVPLVNKEVMATLNANDGNKWGSNQWVDEGKAILQPVSIQGNLIGRDKGGPQGIGVAENAPMYTLNATDVHGVAQPIPLNTMTMQGRPSDTGRMGSGIGSPGDPCPTLTKGHSHAVAQAVWLLGGQHPNSSVDLDKSPTLTSAMGSGGGHVPIIGTMAVRRLTPVECERLQGFPDNYTDIQPKGKPTPDGSRYKALGNSMAVPVMKWIGERINLVENIL